MLTLNQIMTAQRNGNPIKHDPTERIFTIGSVSDIDWEARTVTAHIGENLLPRIAGRIAAKPRESTRSIRC